MGCLLAKHGLLGKQSMFDHSIRVPLIMTGPDIPRGKSIDHEIYLQDIMATTLELADVTTSDSIDFKSFLNLAKGKDKKPLYPEEFMELT